MKPNDKAYEAALRATSDSCSPYQIKNALDAAYAAQFPPSEDYAGLLKMLRSMHKQITSAIEKADPWGITDETVPGKAADAIEAVLAERDALRKWKEEDSTTMRIFARYRELEAEVAAWKGRQEATAAILKQVETERDALKAELEKAQDIARVQAESIGGYIKMIEDRDALLARLAPKDDEELVEIAADAIDTPLPSLTWEEREAVARAAIAAIRPHIEAAERERCAKIAEARFRSALNLPDGYVNGWGQCQRSIAAAIRSGK